MFAKFEAVALVPIVQRPLIAMLALSLMVSAWLFNPRVDCATEANCAFPTPTSVLEEYSAALVGASDGMEEIKADLDDAETTLILCVVLLRPRRRRRLPLVEASTRLDGGRRYRLPEKTGPPRRR